MATDGNRAEEPTPTTWGRNTCAPAVVTKISDAARQNAAAKSLAFFISFSPQEFLSLIVVLHFKS
jgi:hypothetical protein